MERDQDKFMDKMWKAYGGKGKPGQNGNQPKQRVTLHGVATEVSPRRIIDYLSALEEGKK